MDNFFLLSSKIFEIDFLNIKADFRILNLVINISNSFIESIFYKSSFIKESEITNYG